MREIPFGTIQFPLWEYLKLLVAQYSKNGKCEPSQSALCGAVAGKAFFFNFKLDPV